MNEMAFTDLAAQQKVIRGLVDQAVGRVLDHGSYIMGPEISELEQLLAQRAQRRHCVTCSSGTVALQLGLMALGVGPGDRVVVPDFTFAATAEAVCLVGAEPVFADVDPLSYNLDPVSAGTAWDLPGPSPVGIIAADLFGYPCNGSDLGDLARGHDVWLIVDGAQSFGATRSGVSVMTQGVMATTSFYPSKPLGGYGDGGAIFCDDDGLASALRSIRIHGAGDQGLIHERIGMTGRLDTLQAAVLLAKLEVFDQELEKRGEVSKAYSEALQGLVNTPTLEPGVESVWAQYTVEVERREDVRSAMALSGVPTSVFYPNPLHSHPAYQDFALVPNGVPVTNRITQRVLSLPMHPYLRGSEQDCVISSLHSALTDS